MESSCVPSIKDLYGSMNGTAFHSVGTFIISSYPSLSLPSIVLAKYSVLSMIDGSLASSYAPFNPSLSAIYVIILMFVVLSFCGLVDTSFDFYFCETDTNSFNSFLII